MPIRSLLRLILLAGGLIALGTACAAAKAPSPAPDKARLSREAGPLQPQHLTPKLILGANRRVYALWLSFTQAKQSLFDVLFSRSDDDGMTWLAEPVSLQQDKTRNSGSVQLLRGPEGNLYALYSLGLRGRNREVVARRSTNEGATWSDPVVIRSGTDVHAPAFLQDGAGALYAVIPVGGGDFDWKLEVYRSSTGTEWNRLPTLDYARGPTASGIRDFHMVGDGEGRLHAVWSETSRSNGTTPHARIFYNLLSPGPEGGSWLPSPKLLSAGEPTFRGTKNPSLSLADRGRLVAVWQQLIDPDLDRFQGAYPLKVYVARSLDDGSGWAAPTRLSPEGPMPALSAGATVATGAGPNVYASWIEGDSNRPQVVKFSRSTDGGETWTPSSDAFYLADPETYLGAVLHLQADAEGRVYLLWQQLEGKAWKLLFNRSTDHGRTFLPKPYQLARTRQVFPGLHKVTLQVDGPRLFVGWTGGPTADLDVFVTSSLDYGATWLGRDVQINRR